MSLSGRLKRENEPKSTRLADKLFQRFLTQAHTIFNSLSLYFYQVRQNKVAP